MNEPKIGSKKHFEGYLQRQAQLYIDNLEAHFGLPVCREYPRPHVQTAEFLESPPSWTQDPQAEVRTRKRIFTKMEYIIGDHLFFLWVEER